MGIVISSSGQWMEQIAVTWLVLELTESPLLVALAFGVRAFPSLLLSPVGGALADRFDRARLIAVTQAAAAMIAAAMAVLNVTGAVQAWQVLVLVLAFGTFWAFNNPARHALMPTLVPREDLMNAMAVNSSAFNISRVLGPILAGILIATLDVWGVFLLAACLYSAVTVSTFFINAPPRDTSEMQRESLVTNLSAGIRYLREHPTLLRLILVAFIPMTLGMPYTAMMPVFVKDVLGREATTLALISGLTGVGALASTLLLASRGNYSGAGKILFFVGITFGFGILFLGLTASLPAALIISVILGATFMLYMALTMTIVQSMVADQVRGRVTSILMMEFGLTPLGALLMGGIAEASSVSVSLILMGSIVAVGLGVAFLLFSDVRRLDPSTSPESLAIRGRAAPEGGSKVAAPRGDA